MKMSMASRRRGAVYRRAGVVHRPLGLIMLFALMLGWMLAFVPQARAAQYIPVSGRDGLSTAGYTIGPPDDRAYLVTMYFNGEYQWCVQYFTDDPDKAETVTLDDIPQATPYVPGLEITPAQMAYLLSKYQATENHDVGAALSLLAHANFEQPPTGRIEPELAAGAEVSARGAAEKIIRLTRSYAPFVETKAKELIAEAQSAAVVGYEGGIVTGEKQRSGEVSGFAVKNAHGNFIKGMAVSATLMGPAVWSETGTKTIALQTTNGLITKAWRATGNGDVTYKITYTNPVGALKQLLRADTQTTLYYHDKPTVTVREGKTWRVVYDFQPVGRSLADRVTAVDGTFTDILTVSAKSDYGSGQWIGLDQATASEFGVAAGLVPIKFKATAYYLGERPVVASASVPQGAQKLGEKILTAVGPTQLKATFKAEKPGFVTVVWQMLKTDQGKIAELVHANWTDFFGLQDETSVRPYVAQIDSSISVRVTKSGLYLVDDLFITGLPEDHPSFTGDGRFSADTKTLEQQLLFFPAGLEVLEENKAQARVVGSVKVPAKNGFYPSVGSTTFKAFVDDAGKLEPGTYVFVTSFAGDSRVRALTTSVEDKTEQYSIDVQPELHTTLLYEDKKDAVPGYGIRKLIDKVCYTNVEPGKNYLVRGELRDKASGKSLGVTAEAQIVPTNIAGCVEVVFEADAGALAGTTTVAFEKLLEDGREIAVHANLEDLNQTLSFEDAPRLRTSATDAADGDALLAPGEKASIIDRVCEVTGALHLGVQYTIHTDVVTSHGKSVLREPLRTNFTPGAQGACTDIEITFDARQLVGQKVVVFEDIFAGDVLVASHRDLNDAAQTVSFSELPVPEVPEQPKPDPSPEPEPEPEPQPPLRRVLATTGAELGGGLGAAFGALATGSTLVIMNRNRRR